MTNRRTVLRTAAWSVPVVAVATAAPQAAASSGPEPNADANYYWAAEAQGSYTSLVAAASGLAATYSTQVGYQATPWAAPPADGTLVLTLTFSQPVTMSTAPANWTKTAPTGNGPSTTFTFELTPSGFGGALTFNLTGSAAGAISVSTAMSLLNGGDASWTNTPNSADATLVA